MRQYSEQVGQCQPAGWWQVYGRWGHACADLIATGLGLLFPLECLLCLDPGNAGLDLCDGCLADLPRLGPACRRCAMPSPVPVIACGACLARMPSYNATIAAFSYDFPIDGLVRGLKYRGRLAHARLLGSLLGRACRPHAAAIDALVPVPLHRRREATRGYNQALEIARFAAQEVGRPLLADRLLRVRPTAAQAGLGAFDRRANVAGAFVADRSLAGLSVALVDDVLTTGSTAEAAARALGAAGVTHVEVWVVARAAPPRAQR